MLARLRIFYHYLWALGGALWYRFPARELTAIGVTRPKSKNTPAETPHTHF